MSAHKVKLKTNYVNWIASFIITKTLFMKSNMQIINVNAAITVLCRAHIVILFFYFSIVDNMNFYFIKLASDMLQ